MSKRLLAGVTVGLLVLGVVQVVSAESIYFGEDVNHTGENMTVDNPSRISHPNADAAAAEFLSQLQGVRTETFESFATNVSVNELTFGTDLATLSPALTVLRIHSDTTFNGVFPISGGQCLLHEAFGANKFTITFSAPQVAFGFYATDVEIGGNLSLEFVSADGSSIGREVRSTARDNQTGSVLYYGVIDTTKPFNKVIFNRPRNQADGFGFDDFTIGNVENVIPPTPTAPPITLEPTTTPSTVPEPTTGLLIGVGLLGIVVLLRKRCRL